MHKEATVNARIEPKLKKEAETILHEVGLTSAEAVRLFYKQVCLQKGLPFEIRIPNKVTIKTLEDTDKGKNLKRHKNAKEMFDKLGM